MAKIFSMQDAAEISAAPYVARAVERDAARRARHAREAAAAAGKSLHLDPPTSRSADELEAEGLAAFRRAATFASSPRGRLLRALAAMADEHPAAAEAATAAYARGLAPTCEANRAEADTAEIGRALIAMGGLATPAAHAARLALSDLLVETLRRAAE